MASAALACTVIALAFGTFSSLSFAWRWLIGAPTQLSSAALLIAVVGASVKLFLHLKRRVPLTRASHPGLPILFALAFAFAGYWMIHQAQAIPLGGFDARAIWNLHARFLHRGQAGPWKELFDASLFWSHNDYPLLVPGLVDGLWTIARSEQGVVPPIVAIGFGLLAIGIVCSATSAVAGDQRGWLAGLILLATPSFLIQSTQQQADIPLSLYILSTVVFLQFAEIWPHVRFPMLAMAGLSAGFAAWTKNEGLIFVIVLYASQLIAAAMLRAWSRYRQDVVRFTAGLVPIFTLILSFKVFLSPPGDIPLNMAALERMTDVGRYPQIAFAFVSGFLSLGDAFEVGAANPGILLALYLLLYRAPIRKVGATSVSLLLVPVLMIVAYFMVYVISPHDLQWHLDTSLDRLLMQLWPAVVFILATVQVVMSTDLHARAEPVHGRLRIGNSRDLIDAL